MVVEDHHVAGTIVGVQATSGAGKHQQLDAERCHDTHWKSELAGSVTFVAVKTAVESHRGQTSDSSADHRVAVARSGGPREVRNRGEIEDHIDVERARDLAQARAGDQADVRPYGPAAANRGGGGFDFSPIASGHGPDWLDGREPANSSAKMPRMILRSLGSAALARAMICWTSTGSSASGRHMSVMIEQPSTRNPQ